MTRSKSLLKSRREHSSSMTNSLSAPLLGAADLSYMGEGLDRPECVVALGNGEVWVSDRARGVTRVAPAPAPGAQPLGMDPAHFLPNGFALLPDGSFLIANIGGDGGLWRLRPRGIIEPFLTEVDGLPLAVTNFVTLDHHERLWISISTRLQPRELAFCRGIASGFVVVVSDGEARVVADDIGFTNEIQVSPDSRWLYVNETVGRRLSRYRIGDGDSLGGRETVVEFGEGIFPDGMAFDAEGGVWITSVVSNRLLRLRPDGVLQTIFDDSDPDIVRRVEARFAVGPIVRADIDAGRDGVLGNLTSLAFGGDDMRTVYLGSLFNTRLPFFRFPVPGFALAHRAFTPDPDFG